MVISTLRKGALKGGMFLLGVLPVFLGYAYAGIIMFSSSSQYFSSLYQACVSLFALMNGDAIRDSFNEVYVVYPLASRIYIYSFVFLFITAVLNIFIAIVEDAFQATRLLQKQSQSLSEARRKKTSSKTPKKAKRERDRDRHPKGESSLGRRERRVGSQQIQANDAYNAHDLNHASFVTAIDAFHAAQELHRAQDDYILPSDEDAEASPPPSKQSHPHPNPPSSKPPCTELTAQEPTIANHPRNPINPINPNLTRMLEKKSAS